MLRGNQFRGSNGRSVSATACTVISYNPGNYLAISGDLFFLSKGASKRVAMAQASDIVFSPILPGEGGN
jgi:hypothetical protein